GCEPRVKIPVIKQLRELYPCGLLEAKHLADTPSSCLQVNLLRHQAELFRDRLREHLARLDVEIIPTAFTAPVYATLLSADGIVGLTGEERQQAEALRQHCYDRLAGLLSFDPRSVRERAGPLPTPLRQGIPFLAAEEVRQAGLPAIRIILRR